MIGAILAFMGVFPEIVVSVLLVVCFMQNITSCYSTFKLKWWNFELMDAFDF